MKPGLYDVQHVIAQIKRASPPVTREMHKLINNISILLDKNTTRLDSPLEPVLASATEQLAEQFLALCYLRRESVRAYASAYAEAAAQIASRIHANMEAMGRQPQQTDDRIVWDGLVAESAEACDLVPSIFSKLKKGKEVVEDALENRTRVERGAADPDAHLAAYLSHL